MDYELEVLTRSKIVYMRNIGPYGETENFKLMSQFKKWITTNQLQEELNTFGILGIALDNPKEILPQNCRYDVTLYVTSNRKFTSGVKTRRFEGGNYVVFTIPHTTKSVQNFWGNLNHTIKKHQLRVREEPIIERFKKENGYCEFLLPIQ